MNVYHDHVVCRGQHLGLQLKGQRHTYGSAENPCPEHKGQLKTIVLYILSGVVWAMFYSFFEVLQS